MATNNAINAPFPIAPGIGGTGVATVTSTPTASSWAGWDANKNMFANAFVKGYATTVTAAGTTTLTNASPSSQFFTGSTTQTLVLPVTSTLALGWQYYLVNNSSGIVTVQSSGLNNIVGLAPNSAAWVTCILTSGITAASWNADVLEAGSPNPSSVLVSTSSGSQTWLPSLTNGQVVIGSTGATPVAATLAPGGGISITNNGGGISITNTTQPAAGVGITVTNASNLSTIAVTPVTTTLSYSAGTVAWALSSNPWIFSTYTAVTGNATVSAATGALPGSAYTFVHIQAASGGPFTLSWNANYKFPQGLVPSVTTTASAVDMFTFIWDGTFMRCVGIAQNIS